MESTEGIRLRDISLNDGDKEEEQYKQIKPMSKSYSDPNLLDSSNERSYGYSKEFQLKDFKGVSRQSNAAHIKKEYSSLYILGPRNRIRVLAKRIVDSKYPFLRFFLNLILVPLLYYFDFSLGLEQQLRCIHLTRPNP